MPAAMPAAVHVATAVPSSRPTHALAERLAERFARVALGAAFLSAVASRFGWWGGGSGAFAAFERYTGEVVAFAPATVIPFLARFATVAELGLGVALVVGVWPRAVALASAVLLATFGAAMAVSLGIKSPLDYSVFSAAGAALLLALRPSASSAVVDAS